MSDVDKERARALNRDRQQRWRAKHPGGNTKNVATSRRRRKMKMNMHALDAVVQFVAKMEKRDEHGQPTGTWHGRYQQTMEVARAMLEEMDTKVDREIAKKRNMAVTAVILLARLRLAQGASRGAPRAYRRRLATQLTQIEREFREKGWQSTESFLLGGAST